MSRGYDKIPRERWDDPRWIWEMQISGQKHFDSCEFMGTLNDLQYDPEWRTVFDPIKNATGMPEFLERLQSHYNLANPGSNDDGTFHVYQHPSRTNSKGEVSPDQMVALAKRHILTLTEAHKRSGFEEDANRLAGFPISWQSAPCSYHQLEWREQLYARDGRPAGFYHFTAWEFSFGAYKAGVPEIVGDLEEAIYSMANDYALQRYLMQSFMDYELDVNAQYELEWVNNCVFHFDESNCYVTSAKVPDA